MNLWGIPRVPRREDVKNQWRNREDNFECSLEIRAFKRSRSIEIA